MCAHRKDDAASEVDGVDVVKGVGVVKGADEAAQLKGVDEKTKVYYWGRWYSRCTWIGGCSLDRDLVSPGTAEGDVEGK